MPFVGRGRTAAAGHERINWRNPACSKVMIHRKRFFDAEFLHHDETGAVR